MTLGTYMYQRVFNWGLLIQLNNFLELIVTILPVELIVLCGIGGIYN